MALAPKWARDLRETILDEIETVESGEKKPVVPDGEEMTEDEAVEATLRGLHRRLTEVELVIAAFGKD